MGMFDNLRVEASLPDPEYQERTFQTKGLECSLSDYTITREGRLILREVEWQATPEEEMPYYGTPEWEQGGLARMCGMFREKSAQDVVLDTSTAISSSTIRSMHRMAPSSQSTSSREQRRYSKQMGQAR